MGLYELISPLFLFLVSFRRKVRKGISVSLAEVRSQLEGIFAKQDALASQDMRLENLYKRVKYPLVALADEVILTSDWKEAEFWSREILERKFFGTSIAGRKFFELLEELLGSNLSHKDDAEVAQIFYICLCLGFRGRYNEDSEELRNLRVRLYRHLPESMPSGETRLTPDAYHVIQTSGKKLQPVVNLARIAIICIGFCVIYFIVNQFLWYDTIEIINKTVKEIINF